MLGVPFQFPDGWPAQLDLPALIDPEVGVTATAAMHRPLVLALLRLDGNETRARHGAREGTARSSSSSRGRTPEVAWRYRSALCSALGVATGPFFGDAVRCDAVAPARAPGNRSRIGSAWPCTRPRRCPA